MWFAVYDNITGELVSVGTNVGDPLPDHYAVLQLADQPAPDDEWDSTLRTFVPSLDRRPLADVLIYDAADVTKTPKSIFDVNQTAGIDVTIRNPITREVVTTFNGIFGIPIMRWNPVLSRFDDSAPRRIKLEFVNGVASRTGIGFPESGDFGIDDRVSESARVESLMIIQVLE